MRLINRDNHLSKPSLINTPKSEKKRGISLSTEKVSRKDNKITRELGYSFST